MYWTTCSCRKTDLRGTSFVKIGCTNTDVELLGNELENEIEIEEMKEDWWKL